MNDINKKNLFVEIDNTFFVVSVGEYDEDLSFKIKKKEKINCDGLEEGKIINIEKCVESLKKAIKDIENKLNFLFENASVVLNHQEFECINVNGFKKLNGNQILEEDISYILNDVKNKLSESEKKKTIVHLFNTQHLLDNKPIKNLPIGLHGDFYSHQLTFFLLHINELKDIKILLNKCNLDLNKVMLKSFAEGVELIKKEKQDTFFKIKILKNKTQIIYFYNSAFCFYQSFSFGSDIIARDISKVCSLELRKVKSILSELNLNSNNNYNNFLDKKYFQNMNYRKVSLQHIVDISLARIEEIVNVIFNDNVNLKFLKTNKDKIFLELEDKNILRLFDKDFKSQFKDDQILTNYLNDQSICSIETIGELVSKGWIREAIPVTHKKNSWISRIFTAFFE